MPAKQLSRSKGFRASKPKVKTGCATCKIRRIKCDETRPECLRCARFGRKCGGYEIETPVQEQPSLESSERALVPRFVAAEPSTQLFQSDQEHAYFNHYCDETVANLAGAFELPVWSRVILQASYDQPFIRHAVMAIGSLSKNTGLEHASDHPYPTPTDSPMSESLHKDESFVLQNYEKFLQGSRAALKSGKQGRRMALIVCLLIICVEGLQWHHRSVLKHLISGINLLDEWMSSHKKPLLLHGTISSQPDDVEDEIVQQFRMLELEASVLYDPKPLEYHERLRREGNEFISNMPDFFSGIYEARQYLELIMRRGHHFLGTVVPQRPPQSADADNQSLVANFNTFETFNGAVLALQFEQESHAADLRRWSTAYEPLFASSTPDSNDFLSTLLLKIRSRVFGVLLAGELSTSEMIYDSYLPYFAEILSYARTFFSHPCADRLLPEGSYSSNAGLIFPLRLVADRSRSRSMRREAITILKSRTWREGTFWSTSTAQISEWLMGIEEDGVETEEIPEWARARLVQVEFDEGMDVRRVSVRAVKGIGENQEVKEGRWGWGFPGARSESEGGTPQSMSSGSDVEAFKLSFQMSPA